MDHAKGPGVILLLTNPLLELNLIVGNKKVSYLALCANIFILEARCKKFVHGCGP